MHRARSSCFVALVGALLLVAAACVEEPTSPPTTTPPSSSVPLSSAITGDYSGQFGTAGTVTISQSGTGAAATYTVSVKTGFRFVGGNCTLTPGTVIASFTGLGPTYTYGNGTGTNSANGYNFDANSCAQSFSNFGYTSVNTNGTVTIAVEGQSRVVLTKFANGTTTAPTITGDYSINLNGSVGTVTIARAGTGVAATYTVYVKTGFRLVGANCTLTPGSVLAWFTGEGPIYTYGNGTGTNSANGYIHDRNTCAQGTTNFGYTAINTNNTITIRLYDGLDLLTKVTDLPTSPPTITGDYSINLNGSVGSVTIVQAGAGASATYTVYVRTGFRFVGANCTLPAGSVLATFTGVGPSYTYGNGTGTNSANGFIYDRNVCTQSFSNFGYTAINTNNTITIRLWDGLDLLTKI